MIELELFHILRECQYYANKRAKSPEETKFYLNKITDILLEYLNTHKNIFDYTQAEIYAFATYSYAVFFLSNKYNQPPDPKKYNIEIYNKGKALFYKNLMAEVRRNLNIAIKYTYPKLVFIPKQKGGNNENSRTI